MADALTILPYAWLGASAPFWSSLAVWFACGGSGRRMMRAPVIVLAGVGLVHTALPAWVLVSGVGILPPLFYSLPGIGVAAASVGVALIASLVGEWPDRPLDRAVRCSAVALCLASTVALSFLLLVSAPRA